MMKAFPRKTNLYCEVAKMVKVMLKKGSGALVPPSCSLHKSDAHWLPDGLSWSIRTTTAAGHFGHRRRTSRPLNRSNVVDVPLLHWGCQVNLQLEIIQHTQRICGSPRPACPHSTPLDAERREPCGYPTRSQTVCVYQREDATVLAGLKAWT